MMPGSKHFPMLDEPNLFNQQLADFLSFDFAALNQLTKV
jgi:pimeloyl-ACP methyl ester carboxylesterase